MYQNQIRYIPFWANFLCTADSSRVGSDQSSKGQCSQFISSDGTVPVMAMRTAACSSVPVVERRVNRSARLAD